MSVVISKKEFKKKIINNSNLSLVQFKVEWSGACQIISPVYEELSSLFEREVDFFTIDVEMEPGLEDEYGVMELPTILFFKAGKVVDHITGLIPRYLIIEKIKAVLNNHLN